MKVVDEYTPGRKKKKEKKKKETRQVDEDSREKFAQTTQTSVSPLSYSISPFINAHGERGSGDIRSVPDYRTHSINADREKDHHSVNIDREPSASSGYYMEVISEDGDNESKALLGRS